MHSIFGLVLAGGRAARMGRDKAFVALGGRPLVAHVVGRLAPQCAGLVICANGDPARFAGFGPVAADDVAGHPGPLAGVLAGLDHLAARSATHAVSVAVDAPFIPQDLAARLAQAATREGAAIAVAASGGRAHPVAALWPVALRGALRAALARDERGVGRFQATCTVATVEWPTTPVDPFFNVNAPADLAEAERLAALI